jgi:acetyl esterase/lipase
MTKEIFLMKTVLVWCHGGCFGGGDFSYDVQLRKAIGDAGYQVCSVDFTKSYPMALADIDKIVTYYELDGYRVILGGISSGGLLAHLAANSRQLPAVLIAPVLGPYKRHNILDSSQQKLQLSFFGNMETMFGVEQLAQEEPNNTRLIIYGKGDVRAPDIYFKMWQAQLHEIDASHSELCQHPPVDIIIQWIQSI